MTLKYYPLLLCLFGAFLCGMPFQGQTSSKVTRVASNTSVDQDSIKAMLQSEYFEKLYSKTYYSLLDRIEDDGYLPESLTGAYPGMFPRTVGAYVLTLIETEQYAVAEKILKCVFNALAQNKMERIPRVIGKVNGKYTIADERHQIDAQAHVILAWARLALKRGHTQFEDDTWAQVSAIMARTCDRTFFPRGGWSVEPELVRNVAFEHSKEGRFWNVWDLLTQSFVGAAMKDMAVIAERHNATNLANDWNNKVSALSQGIKDNMVTNYWGIQTYVEMFMPNGNGGDPYNGLGWVTLSPIAAGWEGVDHQILKNTVKVMNEKFLKRSNGVVWMPTDGYPNGTFSNEIIGKGMGWEIDFARSEMDYTRLSEILQLLQTVNAGHSIYMEGAWLEGNGIGLSKVISDQDLRTMKTSVWKVKDAGNGEQTAWWCWAMARLRKSIGLSAQPARI